MLDKISQWFKHKPPDLSPDRFDSDEAQEATIIVKSHQSPSDVDPPQSRSDRLALLYRLSQAFNSSLDFNEVLNTVMDEVISSLQAERGFIMLKEGDAPTVFHAARGMDQKSIDDPQLEISRSVVNRVITQGRPVSTLDAQSDNRFSESKSVIVKGLRSILCVPLIIKDQVKGVVYVDNRMKVGMFTTEDLELLTAIASSAAIAIENARLYRMAVEKGRLERDLQMAYELQTGLLPRQTPDISGWAFEARWKPARMVGGDYYDFIQEDETNIGAVIADVSGKGMPAALFMACTRSIIRASMGGFVSPADGLDHANRLICADSVGGTFVTFFYARVNIEIGDVTYVNAGHNPPLLYCPEKAQITRLMRTGIPLGVTNDIPYEQKTVHLEPGDLLLLYTDGVTDATDAQMQSFGMERLERVVFDHGHEPLPDIVSGLEREIDAFAGTAEQFDDIAIVGIKRLE